MGHTTTTQEGQMAIDLDTQTFTRTQVRDLLDSVGDYIADDFDSPAGIRLTLDREQVLFLIMNRLSWVFSSHELMSALPMVGVDLTDLQDFLDARRPQ
jgi:hypothetical protein